MAGLIRVLIVDDDPLVRAGLSLILAAGDDLQIVGEAADGAQALDAARRLYPDVVLMDIRMPRMDGLAATGALRAAGNGAAVIVLTTFDTDEHVLRALRLGASGFLLKDTPPADILESIRRVAAGEPILSPAVVARLIDRVMAAEAARDGAGGPGTAGGAAGERAHRAERALAALAALTEREREVAVGVGQGRSNADIGAELHMSVATVKTYVSRILAKLDCDNRVQVAILVHESRG